MPRRVKNLDATVDDLREEGWKLKHKSSNKAELIKTNWGSLAGHVLVLIFTFWTFGLGNLIYALIKRQFSSRKRVIREVE